MNTQVGTVALYLCLSSAFALGIFEEPVCSKFHFEEKVLEKLIKLEVRVDSELTKIVEKTKKLDATLTALSKSVAEMRDRISDVTKREAKFGVLEKNVEDAIAQLRRDVADRLTAVENGTLTNAQDRGSGDTDLVFFVVHSPDVPEKNKPLVYKTVVSNNGGGYNTGTGRFTAPSTGVYIFSAQICSQNHVDYQIVVDETPYSSSYQYETTAGVCSSVSTPVLVSEGDQVWVKTINGGAKLHSKSSDSNPAWNMFTGTLVMQL